MAITVLFRRTRRTEIRYEAAFVRRADPSSGFGFPCSEDGVIDYRELQPAGKENLAYCLEHRDEFFPPVICEGRREWIEDAQGLCHCGRVVTLSDPLTNSCECGRAYNMGGQEVEANYGRAECARDGWSYDEEG